MSSPSAVTVTSFALRSNSFTSSSSSSFLIATDSVGCETKHASAALPKCFSLATATMYLSSVSVIDSQSVGDRAEDLSPRTFLSLEKLGFSSEPAGRVPAGQFGMAIEHERGQPARPFQQFGVGRKIGETQQRIARLARAQELAGPADFEVAARDL